MAALKRAAQRVMRIAIPMTSYPAVEVGSMRQTVTASGRVPCSLMSKIQPFSSFWSNPKHMFHQIYILSSAATHRLRPHSIEDLIKPDLTSGRNPQRNASTSRLNTRKETVTKEHTSQPDCPPTSIQKDYQATNIKNTQENLPTSNGNTRRTKSSLDEAQKKLVPSDKRTRKFELYRAESGHADITSASGLADVAPASRLADVTSASGLVDVAAASGQPLVLLFPFRGSTAKLREKYCRVYQKLGLDVLCLSEGMTVSVCSVPPLIRMVTRQVMQVLQDESRPFTKQPLIVHCMSGGYMFTGSMLMEMQAYATSSIPANLQHSITNLASSMTPAFLTSIASKTGARSTVSPMVGNTESHCSEDSGMTDLRDRIMGMVLDCPVLTPYLARRGIDISVRNPYRRAPLRACLSLFSPLSDLFYNQYAEAMVTLDSSPKLILHSLSDPLCPKEHVDGLVSKLESQGVPVQTEVFHGADHVRLLGKDPEKYQQAIHQFVRNLGLAGV
ncbi:uncharacterized protein LOC143276902 [Babylonia areolata]|uniref:uncharacterized protein LOC143276902 n=1 Tax=Babylonia areolata TaxID=304850 RepID=UPI003FD48F76